MTKTIKYKQFSGLSTIFRTEDEDEGLHLMSSWNRFLINRRRKATVIRMMQKRHLATGEEWVHFLTKKKDSDAKKKKCETGSESLSSEESNDEDFFWHIFQNDSCNLSYDFPVAAAEQNQNLKRKALKQQQQQKQHNGDDSTLDHLAIFSFDTNSPAVDVSNNYHYYNDYRTTTITAAIATTTTNQPNVRKKKRKLSCMLRRKSTPYSSIQGSDNGQLEIDLPQEIMFAINRNLVYV
jgi:hypothetical protein